MRSRGLRLGSRRSRLWFCAGSKAGKEEERNGESNDDSAFLGILYRFIYVSVGFCGWRRMNRWMNEGVSG